ncbi:general transcription factor II-I repeat domain-containing protein 2 [Trichonephila clavata]|uniref:General transcription factor II-I repeat domain-containing protein 2 n=1 Tax=Trichonephila clavata TaxID=2740835 RepID=A0A8X6HIC4_TRICU|nr:general transcription factor II-I repeat domain-containing protein 2 [Trichonephila clavata]
MAYFSVFLCACDKDFNISEELSELVSMDDTTIGQDIFNCVPELLQKYKLPLSKLNSSAIDGDPSMTGGKKGFVTLLRKNLNEIHGSKIHRTNSFIKKYYAQR